MLRVKVTLAIGLALLATAVGVTLTQAPMSLARRSARSTNEEQALASTRHRTAICQAGEVLPRDTSAIRVHMFAEYGPKVAVKVLERGQVIAGGQQGAGWTGGAVTLPVRALPTRRSPVTLCFTLSLNGNETVSPLGEHTDTALAAREGSTILPGRLSIEYLRPGASSWWSLLGQVARHAGLGRAASGTWSVVLVAALMAGALLLCSGLIVRELR